MCSVLSAVQLPRLYVPVGLVSCAVWSAKVADSLCTNMSYELGHAVLCGVYMKFVQYTNGDHKSLPESFVPRRLVHTFLAVCE